MPAPGRIIQAGISHAARPPVDRKEQGVVETRVAAGVERPRGGVCGQNLFEFSSKNAGFYAFFIAKTTLVARNRDQVSV